MIDDNKIVTVNGPVIEGYMLQPLGGEGVIYSVRLSNGIIVTSPEAFEALSQTINHKAAPPIRQTAA